MADSNTGRIYSQTRSQSSITKHTNQPLSQVVRPPSTVVRNQPLLQLSPVSVHAPPEVVNVPLFRVKGSIAGTPAIFLIDCGSTADVLSSWFTQLLQQPIRIYSYHQAVKLATGVQQSSSSIAAGVPIQLDSYTDKCDIVMLSLEGYDVILGLPWLQRYNPVINWNTFQIQLQHKDKKHILQSTSLVRTPLPISMTPTGEVHTIHGQPDDSVATQSPELTNLVCTMPAQEPCSHSSQDKKKKLCQNSSSLLPLPVVKKHEVLPDSQQDSTWKCDKPLQAERPGSVRSNPEGKTVDKITSHRHIPAHQKSIQPQTVKSEEFNHMKPTHESTVDRKNKKKSLPSRSSMTLRQHQAFDAHQPFKSQEVKKIEEKIISARQLKKLIKKKQVAEVYVATMCTNPNGDGDNMVRISSIQSKPNKSKIDKILMEYKDVFPDDLPLELPPSRDIDFKIDLIPGHTPPNLPSYRQSPKELDEVRKQLKEL